MKSVALSPKYFHSSLPCRSRCREALHSASVDATSCLKLAGCLSLSDIIRLGFQQIMGPVFYWAGMMEAIAVMAVTWADIHWHLSPVLLQSESLSLSGRCSMTLHCLRVCLQVSFLLINCESD